MVTLIEAKTLNTAVLALCKLIEENEVRGEKNLIFCEDKLTLICEREILSALKGAFNTEVMTFARFLSGPQVLSKQGSVMLISSIIEENRDLLSCFRERSAGAVYETIAQLNASRVDDVLLDEGAAETDGLLKSKLSDLARIFSLYRKRLSEGGYLDESEYLSLLPEKIVSAGLEETHVFFFGFPSFTRQAQEGVRAALDCAKSVTGIFLSGEEDYFTNESSTIFLRLSEGRELRRLRFSDEPLSEEAELLSKSLFSSRMSEGKMKTERVKRFVSPDERAELETVCALIKREIDLGKRYRDIAVLVPDRECFANVERCFRAYKIPFYADKKRAFSEHPFCRFVLAVLNAVADGVLPEEADEIAASYYFGNGGNDYRNYLLKFGGYRGAVRREIKEGDLVAEYDRDALIACRERMLKILSLFPRRANAGEYAGSIKKLYDFVSAERRTEELKENFTGAEREFLSLKSLEGVLEEMAYISGGKQFSAREFFEQLKNGLSALEISMIPQSLDAVFVGDVTESRFLRVKTLFVVGLDERIPRVSQDSALISDGEMEKLEKLKVEIEPKIEQVNARACEGLALNLCNFEESLYLSYSLQRGGEATERGRIFQEAEEIFDMPSMPLLFPYDCSEESPAILKILQPAFTPTEKAQHDALYGFLNEEYGESFLEKILSGGKKEKLENATPPAKVSPTLLEKYYECPYASFVSRILRLKEREERTLLDTDAGNFVHATLKECADRFEELKTPEDCRACARGIANELMESPRYRSLKDTPQGEYTAKRLLKEAEEVCLQAYLQVVRSEFHVKKTEEDVCIPDLSLTGKPDRIDWSEEFIRVIDYKTGNIDDKPVAYYTGRKLQLELYLKAASSDALKPAGAFYFPASERFSRDDDGGFRLRGFFCKDEDVLLSMDPNIKNAGCSEFFEGKTGGRASEKGMSREDFDAFLDYSVLLSSRAEREMGEGFLEPLPYEGSCTYCKLKSLCGFIGEPRSEQRIGCREIALIVKREKGEI